MRSGTAARILGIAVLAAIPLFAQSKKDERDAIFATYRLLQEMQSMIQQMNTNAAELSARVDSSDRETKQLASISQENQVKIDRLISDFSELKRALYQQMGLTPPPSGQSVQPLNTTPGELPPPGTTPQVSSGGVLVEPPQAEPLGIGTQAPGAAAGSQDAAEVNRIYEEARQLYGSENYKEALELFDTILTKWPTSDKSSDSQYWKAHCYFKMEDFQTAITEFQLFQTSYADHRMIPTAMHNQAVAYSRLGQYESARQTFQRLIDKYPNDVVADMARDKIRQLQGVN
ncbi:MAG: tetratricopeptide repeat protein [Candidatus Hydrogenedentota bacterium]